MKSQKVVLSENMPNNPERKFLEAVNRTCDEHPDLSYLEALRLTASEQSALAQDFEKFRRLHR